MWDSLVIVPHGKKVKYQDRAVIGVQTVDTIIKWHSMLNCWKWPDELPNEESPKKRYKHTNRRGQLMDFMERVVGCYYILREHNSEMTDAEFIVFWKSGYDEIACKSLFGYVHNKEIKQ